MLGRKNYTQEEIDQGKEGLSVYYRLTDKHIATVKPDAVHPQR
jgi:hypothetical protein